ncbi:hypothetical protein EVAR_74740_1 [Eumeta japonica]|uniref:Uncharacterized protein n=1 Tax=Eumeta variegata TaxID=151549 RepID=A0A4C1SNY4_EUMVA|nr:hypothetical protein EVAR_74740_1 [Eumeta japonica]
MKTHRATPPLPPPPARPTPHAPVPPCAPSRCIHATSYGPQIAVARRPGPPAPAAARSPRAAPALNNLPESDTLTKVVQPPSCAPPGSTAPRSFAAFTVIRIVSLRYRTGVYCCRARRGRRAPSKRRRYPRPTKHKKRMPKKSFLAKTPPFYPRRCDDAAVASSAVRGTALGRERRGAAPGCAGGVGTRALAK